MARDYPAWIDQMASGGAASTPASSSGGSYPAWIDEIASGGKAPDPTQPATPAAPALYPSWVDDLATEPPATPDPAPSEQDQIAARLRDTTADRARAVGSLRGSMARSLRDYQQYTPPVRDALATIYRDTRGTSIEGLPGGPADLPAVEPGGSWTDIPLEVARSFPGPLALYDWGSNLKALVSGEKDPTIRNIGQVATGVAIPGFWRLIGEDATPVPEDPDAAPSRTAPVVAGQILSTLSRPGAVLARAAAENRLVEERGELDSTTGERTWTDPETGRVTKHQTAEQIMSDMVSALSPIPGTQRADASYIDAARALSQSMGGTGDEAGVYVAGLAGDILLDPSTYLTAGGSAVAKGGKQIQRIMYRALADAGRSDALETAAKIGQHVAFEMGKVPKSEVLETTADIARTVLGGDVGERAYKEILALDEAFGQEGVKVFGREIPGLRGEQLAAAKEEVRSGLTEQLRKGGRWVDHLIVKQGEDVIGKEQGSGGRAVEDFLKKAGMIHDFFSTAPRPGASRGAREVVAAAAAASDITEASLGRAQREYSDIARRSGLGLEEKKVVSSTMEMGNTLAWQRRKAGQMYSPDEMQYLLDDGTTGRGEFSLTSGDHFKLGKVAELVYARTIARAKSAEEATTLIQQDLPRALLSVLPADVRANKFALAGIEERLSRGDLMLERLGANVAEDWKTYDTAWKELPGHLRRLVTWISDEFAAMLAREQAAGLDVEGIDAYVPHIIRNKDKIMKAVGLRTGKAGGEKFTAHRTVGSIAELKEGGLDPVEDVFQLLAARRVAHEHALRIHGWKGQVATRFGRPIKAGTAGVAESMALAARKADGIEWRPMQHGGQWYLVDQEIKEAVERVEENWGPRNINKVLQWYDRLQAWWKSRATSGRLGFVTRNAWSDLWNMSLGGWKDPRTFGQAFDLGFIGHSLEDVEKQVKEFRPADYKPGYFTRLEDRGRARLIEKGKKAAARVYTMPDGRTLTGQQLYDMAVRTGIVEKGWVSADIERDLMQEVGKAGRYGAARAAMQAFRNVNPAGDNILLRMGSKASRWRENWARMAFFLDRVQKGDSAEDAARVTKQFMFDYKDLSTFDRGAKRLIPFWTWTRKNVPLQVASLFRKPGQMAVPAKIARASDKRNEYEEETRRVQRQLLQGYLQNIMPFSTRGRLGLPGIPDTGNAYLWAPDMPYRDLTTLDLDGGSLSLAMLSPLPRLFRDVTMGNRLDTGESIEDDVEIPPLLKPLVMSIPRAFGGGVRGPMYDASGREIDMMSGRLFYALSTMFPDVSTWGRLLGVAAGGEETPQAKEKRMTKVYADLTGILRMMPVEKAATEAAWAKDAKKKLEAARPYGMRGKE